MKIRDELANDISAAIQDYIGRYPKFKDIPEDRKKDLQTLWVILQENNPIILRKRLEKKLIEMPSGVLLFFMFDLKKLKIPLLDVLNQEKYQKYHLKNCYEKELYLKGKNLKEEDILHLVKRVDQLEDSLIKHEKQTYNLELKVSRLTKENTFLTERLQVIHEERKQLLKEKNEVIKRAELAEAKLQSIEDKYLDLLDENKQLKAQMKLLKNYGIKHVHFIEPRQRNLSSIL